MNTKSKIISITFYLTLLANFNSAYANHNSVDDLKVVFCQDRFLITETPSRTIHKFLRWYKQNEKKLNVFPLKQRVEGDSSFYSVDFSAAEEYIRELNKSNLFAPVFLTSLRKYLKVCESNLRAHPQNDFIPRGFETNLVTKLMDNMGIMEDINSARLSSSLLSGKRAAVNVKGPYSPRSEMLFKLTNYAGVWKIDSINGDFPKYIE